MARAASGGPADPPQCHGQGGQTDTRAQVQPRQRGRPERPGRQSDVGNRRSPLISGSLFKRKCTSEAGGRLEIGGNTVEFGIFIQGYIPGPAAHESEAEHTALLNDVAVVQAADRNNFKFAWVSEHHALPEYSHISASDVFAGHLAASTERIHIASGIFNVSPRVNHPVRNAERVAMLDHLSNRRFEFGTGRGAGSHEVGTFNIHDPSSTKADYDDVIREFVRMWEQQDYKYQGARWSLDVPHNILPKPYAPGHPPIWVACGNPPTFQKAGELGIGVCAFTFDSPAGMRSRAEMYKQAVAECTDPAGQYKNDNIMITSMVYCAETRERAREQALRFGARYVITLVTLYHDSFVSEAGVRWPHPPERFTEETLDEAIDNGVL